MLKDLILGSHLFFAREGDLIDAVTVAVDAKPDAVPEANWQKFGTIEQFEPQNSQTFIERRAPSPGRYRTRKKIPIAQKLMLNFSIQEWDQITLAELLFNANKPMAGVFVPNSRVDGVRGWFKIQCYDQNDQTIVVMDVWGECTISSYQFKEGLDPYTLKVEVLQSDLNQGSITNL